MGWVGWLFDVLGLLGLAGEGLGLDWIGLDWIGIVAVVGYTVLALLYILCSTKFCETVLNETSTKSPLNK